MNQTTGEPTATDSGSDVLQRLRPYIGVEWMPNYDDIPLEPLGGRDVWAYAAALDDENPLWVDDDFARRHGWPSAPAPSGIMELYAPNYRAYYKLKDHFDYLKRMMPFPSPFGSHWDTKPIVFLLSEQWDVYQPLTVGRHVHGASFIHDLEWKDAPGRPQRLVITYKKKYTDRTTGELLGETTWRLGMFSERPVAGAAAAAQDSSAGTSLRIAERSDPAAAVGAYLPDHRHRMVMETTLKWSASIWDMGTPHYDYEYARDVLGLDAPLVNGPLINATASRAITDWMSPSDLLVQHRAAFRKNVLIGESIRARFKVVSFTDGDGQRPDELHLVGEVRNGDGALVADLTSVLLLNAARFMADRMPPHESPGSVQ